MYSNNDYLDSPSDEIPIGFFSHQPSENYLLPEGVNVIENDQDQTALVKVNSATNFNNIDQNIHMNSNQNQNNINNINNVNNQPLEEYVDTFMHDSKNQEDDYIDIVVSNTQNEVKCLYFNNQFEEIIKLLNKKFPNVNFLFNFSF